MNEQIIEATDLEISQKDRQWILEWMKKEWKVPGGEVGEVVIKRKAFVGNKTVYLASYSKYGYQNFFSVFTDPAEASFESCAL